MYMCHAYLGTHRDQKRESNPLELELQMVMNHHANIGNLTWVSTRETVLLIAEPSLQVPKLGF